MKLTDTVLGILKHGAGATLALAIGCGSAAGPELHAIGKPSDAPPVGASAPTAVLVPVPTMDPFAPAFAPPPALTPASPVVAATPPPTRRRHRRTRVSIAHRPPNMIDIAPMCGRG